MPKKKNIKKQKKSISKRKRIVEKGYAYIFSTYNNTIVTLTDTKGDVITSSSAGRMGFKGPKKATPYAAGVIVRDAVEKAKSYKLKTVDVFIKGVGSGREAAVRALYNNGLNITSIKDRTPIPHNGPRPKKVRRV
ncbi:MAG: 30S ribosomal protein S11 [Patescibacteria group bacterium]|nr:30S ribosomal protein S11 [Patescibacteria group bacterium]